MKRDKNPLLPLNNIIFVTEKAARELSPSEISKESVGNKAYGLSCLPQSWTLPFFVISADLLSDFREGKLSENLTDDWKKTIEEGAIHSGIGTSGRILIRSSATNESLEDSGKFITIHGHIENIYQDLYTYLSDSLHDQDTLNRKLYIVVQKAAASALKGHLSNELHCCKEARDWHGQIELSPSTSAETFAIALRSWRSTVDLESAVSGTLECNAKLNIQKTLKLVASWGETFTKRIHFEWAWDKKNIYIVQAEEEILSGSFDPISTAKIKSKNTNLFTPNVIRSINQNDAKKYSKIHNIYIYMELGLSDVPLFILDDKKIINDISTGQFSNELISDLNYLTSRSLVIRADIETADQSQKQMLPRTPEVRTLEEAKSWLEKNAKTILEANQDFNIAFIFHNFIPAESSAFAFAAPSERKVQIESLWGIPEGLYYNSHDKYIVDTLNADIEKCISETDFSIKDHIHSKPFCVAPNSEGKWLYQKLDPRFYWSQSIRKSAWIKKIALESRRIAERENKSVSIMWFIGVPHSIYKNPVIPWFHEQYYKSKIPRAKNRRKKTTLDKHATIRTVADIEALQNQIDNGEKSIKQLLIQPMEEEILRDKNTLKKIGLLAKQIDAVILLEGATLSHAFYQLIQTGAIVNIESPFDKDEDTKEFNKLVRDFIPEKIEKGGERVIAKKLEGEVLIKALREKLVEEAIEVLDARDHDSVVDEIADVLEVIDALSKNLGANKSEIEKRRQNKRKKVGGFDKGLILIGTENPAPSSLPEESQTLPLALSEPAIHQGVLNEINTANLKKWTDRRIHPSTSETILNIETPLLQEKWDAMSQDFTISDSKNQSIQAKLNGKRIGSTIKIEVSIVAAPMQGELDF